MEPTSWIVLIQQYGRSGAAYGPFTTREIAKEWAKGQLLIQKRVLGYSIHALFDPPKGVTR